MASFAELRRAKELGLNLTALLVKSYLDEHGATPVGLIARACMTSVRSVERAIALLKEKGLFFVSSNAKMTHEHDHSVQEEEGSASVSSAAPVASADPVAQALLDEGVLPWCVEVLRTKVSEEVLLRQLRYHRHRLEGGFKFKAHPAKFLFKACLNDWQPPQDYFERQNRPHEPQAPAKAAAVPVAQPQAEMTREGALSVVRLGLKSRLPHMREQALRLAAQFDIDTRALAG